MEHNNGCLKDDLPFQRADFLVRCQFSGVGVPPTSQVAVTAKNPALRQTFEEHIGIAAKVGLENCHGNMEPLKRYHILGKVLLMEEMLLTS